MKKFFVRIVAMLTVVAMLILPLSSCGSGKKLLTLKVDGKSYSISVNLYELMLSITKGTLDAYGYTLEGKRPTDAAFWEIMDTFDDTTYETADAFYRKKVLEDCKTYLISLYLFDKYDLQLSESVKVEIQDKMEEFIQSIVPKMLNRKNQSTVSSSFFFLAILFSSLFFFFLRNCSFSTNNTFFKDYSFSDLINPFLDLFRFSRSRSRNSLLIFPFFPF